MQITYIQFFYFLIFATFVYFAGNYLFLTFDFGVFAENEFNQSVKGEKNYEAQRQTRRDEQFEHRPKNLCAEFVGNGFRRVAEINFLQILINHSAFADEFSCPIREHDGHKKAAHRRKKCSDKNTENQRKKRHGQQFLLETFFFSNFLHSNFPLIFCVLHLRARRI